MSTDPQHIALFYDDDPALWAQCATLITSNAAAGGQWLFIADEHTPSTIQAALAAAGVDLAQGRVEPAVAYAMRASPVRVAPIVAALRAALAGLISNGAVQVVLLIEMTWAIRTPSADVYLREYEAALHQLLAEFPLTLVCLYNQSVLLDRQLLDALCAHPQVYTGQTCQPNPYFVPPPILVRRDVRAQFDYWLQTLTQAEPPAANKSAALLEPIYHLEAPSALIADEGEQGHWKVRCLGTLRVYREDGAAFAWRVEKGATRKTKTLFAYLLLRGEQGATVEELADLLWPDARETHQSVNRLYHVIHSLRLVLAPQADAQRQSPYLLYRDQRYFLAVPPHTWIDLPMFQELCYRGNQLAQRGDVAQALICYQAAERLYTGDFLADIPEKYADHREQDWCWSRRYWLREMQVKMLWSMATLYRQADQIAEALAACDKALRSDPCCEAAHMEKLRSLHAAKRRDALDRQYKLYGQALAQFEMGAPAPEVTGLYQELRGGL